MKKQIIIGIGITACVALCAAVWTRSAEVGDLPAEPIKTAVNAQFEARSEKKPQFLLTIAVINGVKSMWIPGLGWVKDEGGGSVGTFAADMYENGNKIGIMGGGTTVGNPGDELIGNKVGIMGGEAMVGSDGDINKQVGIMGGEEPTRESTPPLSARPEPTGDVIYIELQPTPTKDSTPLPYKQNATNP